MLGKAPFTVRKQTSGYTGAPSFYVYDLQSKGRVSVHAMTRESALASAQGLNESVGWDPEPEPTQNVTR